MTDRCSEYALAVVRGDIPNGELAILACARHLNDIKRQETEGFPFSFHPEVAGKIFQFAEKLSIAEGNKPKRLRLFGFQCFILGSLYGWLDRNGYRRFRLSYIEMGRQNGKSFLNGINAAWLGNFSGYNYGQLYLTATKQKQAKIVFNEVVKFINSDSDLQELFSVKDYISEINCNLTNSKIIALSKDTQRVDGFRPLFGSVDEYHAHTTNQMFKLLEGGTGGMDESLISIITTAGFDLNSPCFEQHKIAEQVLRGTFKKESMFAMIFTMSKDADIWDSQNWIQSNPLTCSSPKGIENMREIAETARFAGGAELRDFMTKRLNIWVQSSDNQFIDVEKLALCGSNKNIASFDGAECYAGIDLSSGGDLTSITIEIPYLDGDRQKYYFFSHSFMPRARLAEHVKTDDAPYDMWEMDGLLTVTGGDDDYKNDYSFIVSYLRDIIENNHLTLCGIGYDPHNADGFLAQLEEFACPLTAVTQSCKFLNDATQDIQLLVKSQQLEYDISSGLLVWSLVNAVTVSNSFGEIKVDKQQNKRQRRIDPVDALIDAHVIAIKRDTDIDIDASINNYFDMMDKSLRHS